ncbi:MAG: S8 family serine peptidase, partial [Anaerolineae bacterium]
MRTRVGQRFRLPLYLVLICCLLLVTVLPAAQPLIRPLPMDPALRALLAEAEGDARIAVIVQKATPGDEAEALVRSLGGEVVRSWSIIPAFLANLSADAVRQLAQSGLVRWISWDSPMVKQDTGQVDPMTSLGAYLSAYNYTIGATTAWNYGFKGNGIAVAVVDSGITPKTDFLASSTSLTRDSRIRANVTFASTILTYSSRVNTTTSDLFGHGTHIAGIIGSNGASSAGLFMGVAPEVNLINLRVADYNGRAFESDMVDALQWIYEHHKEYNIRVVNVSM